MDDSIVPASSSALSNIAAVNFFLSADQISTLLKYTDINIFTDLETLFLNQLAKQELISTTCMNFITYLLRDRRMINNNTPTYFFNIKPLSNYAEYISIINNRRLLVIDVNRLMSLKSDMPYNGYLGSLLNGNFFSDKFYFVDKDFTNQYFELQFHFPVWLKEMTFCMLAKVLFNLKYKWKVRSSENTDWIDLNAITTIYSNSTPITPPNDNYEQKIIQRTKYSDTKYKYWRFVGVLGRFPHATYINQLLPIIY